MSTKWKDRTASPEDLEPVLKWVEEVARGPGKRGVISVLTQSGSGGECNKLVTVNCMQALTIADVVT